MGELRCSVCRSSSLSEWDMDDNGEAVCETCRTVHLIPGLLDLASDAFRERVIEFCQPYRAYAYDPAQKLMQEAGEAAERGDFDEARLILDRLANPKWASESQCWKAYREAMR